MMPWPAGRAYDRGAAARTGGPAVTLSLFLILKLVHILAAVTALGANLTYPFWLRRAAGDRQQTLDAIDGIARLDSRIANPAYIVVFLAGITMVATGAYSFQTFWIAAAIVLFILVAVLGIALYAPAVRRQRALAESSFGSADYAAAERRQNLIGLLVTGLVVVIVFLMVVKPTLS
jgi:uncharacterized membrane protein